MSTLRLFLKALVPAVSAHRSFCRPVKCIEVDSIRSRIASEADESSTFGQANVAALSCGYYGGDITILYAIKESDEGYADAYKVIGIDEASSECENSGIVPLSTSIESIGENAFYLSGLTSYICHSRERTIATGFLSEVKYCI